MNVLIVDDDQMICDGTARRLEKSGIQEITDITCAYSAEETMAIFEKKTIHVLFSDIRMNGLTGLELIEAVKRLQPYVICIIVTAYDQFQYAQQAIRVGVHEFLVKPCSGREMRDQALHAVNRMQDSEPQRRRMLDEALRSAAIQASSPVDEIFRYHAMEAPRQIRVLRFSGTGASLPLPEGTWRYIPKEADFLLLDALPDAALGMLKTNPEVAGISSPGSDLYALYQEAGEQRTDRQIVATAMRYAKEHICDQLDMAVVANAMNLSYSYFSRIFHEETGMTFSKYMQKLRIEEAGKMLLAGEKLVEIAAKLGYQNAANLTRAFTRELGMSPSQWMDRQIKQ